MIRFLDLNDYGSESASNQINSVGNNCKNDMKWAWSSGFKNKEGDFKYWTEAQIGPSLGLLGSKFINYNLERMIPLVMSQFHQMQAI